MTSINFVSEKDWTQSQKEELRKAHFLSAGEGCTAIFDLAERKSKSFGFSAAAGDRDFCVRGTPARSRLQLDPTGDSLLLGTGAVQRRLISIKGRSEEKKACLLFVNCLIYDTANTVRARKCYV